MAAEILGRQLDSGFQVFYTTIENEISHVQIEYVLFKEGEVHGGRPVGKGLLGVTNVSKILTQGVARIGLYSELDDAAFSYTAAHEILHVLDHIQDYPTAKEIFGGPDEGPRVAGMVRETIGCVAIAHKLEAFDLDPSASYQIRIDAFERDLQQGVKLQRTDNSYPMFVRLVLRYVRAGLEVPESLWKNTKLDIQSTWPEVAKKGERVITRLNEIGLTTQGQQRKAYRHLQNTLGLGGIIDIKRDRS